MATRRKAALNALTPAGPIDQKWTSYKQDMKLVSPANKRKYNVLVVGSGLAGASAAASLGTPSANATDVMAVKTAAVVMSFSNVPSLSPFFDARVMRDHSCE